MKTFNEREKAKKELDEAHNALESFILETRDKLDQSEYEAVTETEEREAIKQKLTETSDWLYEDSDGATIKVLLFCIFFAILC